MIRLVVGLPGSGKSYYLAELARQGWVIVDDPKAGDLPRIQQLALTHSQVAIADYNLCLPSHRLGALQALAEHSLEWVFFANDPKQCLHNASRRPGKLVENTIRLVSPSYQIPAGAQVIPVWSEPRAEGSAPEQ